MQRPAKGIKITGVLSPCDPRCFDPGGCKEGSAMAPFAVRSSMPRTFLLVVGCVLACAFLQPAVALAQRAVAHPAAGGRVVSPRDRKSTRLNSSHGYISYAVFCLKKKKSIWSIFVCTQRWMLAIVSLVGTRGSKKPLRIWGMACSEA